MKTKLLGIVLLLDLFIRLTPAEGQYNAPPPPPYAGGSPLAYCPPNPPPAYAGGSPAYCPPNYPVGSPAFPYSRTTPLQTLLYVRIGGPAGMKVTFYRDSNQAVTFDAPCTVGMRPGYFYRIAVSGMKRYPSQTFYPTIEVRGSLLLGSKLKACDYPAGLVFREEDFAQAQDGGFVRKVIFVEKVEHALPQSSSPDNPLELTVPRNRDPLDEARERGLPVMIVEVGERNFTVPDLLCQAIPGTLLLPGDTFLPRPAVTPCLPWSCFPIYDPLLGPAPWLYYTLPDGGDWGEPVGYDRFGRLVGRDPSDTIAEYKNSKDEKKIAISNRVFLCIPRFIVAKNVPIRLADLAAPLSLDARHGSMTQLDMNAKFAPRGFLQPRHLELVREKLKLAGIDRLQVTAVTGRIRNLEVTSTIIGPANITGIPTQPKVVCPQPEGLDAPLKVDKWPDCCGGIVGSIITFFIRYTNVGGQPITNVIVSDNLISRFEYVPGSAQTSRAANFTAQPNNVGSTIVQWEIDGVLKPGEQGTVSFKVKIR